MRVVFMGTSEFAAPALTALLAAGHEIAAVYTQKARPSGRGQRERESPVQRAAEAQNLIVRTPTELKSRDAQSEFAELRPDVAVVVSYGLILPKPILSAPRLGAVNIHASLLPRWRGAAPIHRAILAGDSRTGITLMQMNEGLDTGDILLQEAIPIQADDTARALHDRLAALGARLVVDALPRLDQGGLARAPQPADGATYAAKLSRDEGRIDWRRTATEIERQVRAFDPWPGAWLEHHGERIKVLAAQAVATNHDAVPGAVLDGAPSVACGEGALRLVRLQRAGKAALPALEFLRGFALPPGAVLGGGA